LRYHEFWCILLVTGLVTDLKHRVMVMLWKIFVVLTYHIVIFNAYIINFMACALFPVVLREKLIFLSDFLPFWAKIILRNIYIWPYILFQTTKTHRIWIIFDVLTMTELSTLSHDSWWVGIKVHVWFSANWNKKVALQILTLPNSQANDPQNTRKDVSNFPDDKNTWMIYHRSILCASNDYAICHISCQLLGSYQGF
jgi:hypothetical protein